MKVKWGLGLAYAVYVCCAFLNIRSIIHGSVWLGLLCLLWTLGCCAFTTLDSWPVFYHRKPDFDIPDGATYTQPILGWRIWRLREDGGLDSVVYALRGPWIPKTAHVAVCRPCTFGGHPMPQRGCTCGIYSLKEMSHVFWTINRHSSSFASDPVGILPDTPGVLGLVYLWGNIVEGEDGYRAEYAYPAKLFIVDNDDNEDQIRAVAANFGIPCDKFSGIQKYLFKTGGGTKWISASQKESLQSSLLSSLFPPHQSESLAANRVA